MARTRAQRRRRTLIITVALVATLLVLLFARDVSRAAHGAITARRSENRSFGALANTLIAKENNFDGRLDRLLSQGASLRRYVFAARLDQLGGALPGWITAADQLRRPKLAHGVSESLYELTLERADAYETLLSEVAHALTLPWNDDGVSTIPSPAPTLIATSERWNMERFALVKEPGTVRLAATSTQSAHYVQASGFGSLVHSANLHLVRAISLAAVRVKPAPLPAKAGVWLLPPVTSVHLGVSVMNEGFDLQPVTLTIQVTPLNRRGAPFAQTMRATLAPLQGYAFVPKSLTTAASEQARVVLRVTGAPAAAGEVTTEVFRLVLSPSGTTPTS